MAKKSCFRRFSLLLLLLALAADAVVAQQGLSDSFSRILGGESLADFYLANSLWVDLVIYAFLFVYVAKFAFHKQQGLNKAAAVLGLALAVSSAVYESQSGFRLGDIGPFALALALLVFGMAVFRLFQGLNIGGEQSAAFAYVAALAFLSTVASPLFELLRESAENNPALALIDALLNIFLVVAVIAIIVGLGRWVSKLFGGHPEPFDNVYGPHHPSGAPGPQHEPHDAHQPQPTPPPHPRS